MTEWEKFERMVNLKSDKVELGAIDDLSDKYKQIAGRVAPLKAQIEKGASELRQIVKELNNLQDDAKKLEEMAKFLGADSVMAQAKQLFQTSGNLSGSWGSAASKIESAAKGI
jgi:DNA repair exonuclease SbcCD ATPase subunit